MPTRLLERSKLPEAYTPKVPQATLPSTSAVARSRSHILLCCLQELLKSLATVLGFDRCRQLSAYEGAAGTLLPHLRAGHVADPLRLLYLERVCWSLIGICNSRDRLSRLLASGRQYPAAARRRQSAESLRTCTSGKQDPDARPTHYRPQDHNRAPMRLAMETSPS